MDSAHGKWLRGIFGLSVLPSSAMQHIAHENTNSKFLRNPPRPPLKLIACLRTTYTSNVAIFRPSMWAGLDSIGKSTNNGEESFHRHFGDLFGYLRCKPTLPHFLRNVEKYNTYKDIKLRSSKAGTVYSREVEDQMSLFDRKRINVRTLLYRLSKKNQPKVKSVYKRKMSYKR